MLKLCIYILSNGNLYFISKSIRGLGGKILPFISSNKVILLFTKLSNKYPNVSIPRLL